MLLMVACGSNVPREVEQALKLAKGNRPELEKVINHYQRLEDSLKLKAAYFLIANMEDKCSVEHPASADGHVFLGNELSKHEKDHRAVNNVKRQEIYNNLARQVDSIKASKQESSFFLSDLTTIKADFLIDNIDLAFETWNNPWSKQFPFEQFCENILPYRVLNEPVLAWRKLLLDEYAEAIDSIKHTTDVNKVALALNKAMADRFYRYEQYNMESLPSIASMVAHPVGGCNQNYQLGVALFRAFGIPAAIDFTPQYTYWFNGHSWVVYWDSTGIKPIDAGDARRPTLTKLTGKYLPLGDGIATCVYRHTYAIDRHSLHYRRKTMAKPQLFANSCLLDVTHEYEFPQQTLTFDLSKKLSRQKVLYLSSFTYRQQLHALSWASPQNKQVQFEHVGNSGVYFLATYDNGALYAMSSPMLIRNNGEVEELLPQAEKTQEVILTRKCKILLQMQEFAQGMVGTVFEGSNTPDFKNATVLYTITEMPDFLVEKAVSNSEKYRYVRYYSPQNEVRVAELQFFGKDVNGAEHRLNGKIISSIAPKDTAESKPRLAFDGSVRTNFNAPQNSWIGLDFGRAVQVSKVAYLPRNNWNIIEPDNQYELLYYDNGWCSLGVKTAEEQYLKYNNVPVGALLVLKNLTQGKEERIFTYENGKQVWW